MFGVKVYSYDWRLVHNLHYEVASQWFHDHGIDFVIAQNRYVPMQDNAVPSAVSAAHETALTRHDDAAWIASLRHRGIQYWAACNVFFDPPALRRFPDAVPVDRSGKPAQQLDWYAGICPTHEPYLEDKIGQIAEAVRHLKPNGIHLGFMRFPGFWELWLPQTRRDDHPEYCFCPRCCERFAKWLGDDIPKTHRDKPWKWATQKRVYDHFVDWKTDVVKAIIARIRRTIHSIAPDVPIMLNTLPFCPDDFERAGREVFAQDWHKLASAVDAFEVMTYHQILARDVEWIGRVVRCVKSCVEKPVVSTIQANPLYLHGIHAESGRRPTLPPEEFREAIAAAQAAGAEHVVLFTWDDLLSAPGDISAARKLDAIRRVRESRR